MKAYTQFLKELPSKKVVFAFGRFQPPTTGHELLVRAVERLASTHNASHVIYASRTQDKTKNPLPVDRKVYFLKRMFPTANFMAAGPTTRTFIEVAKELNKKYKDIIMVAGSDRVAEYTKLLNQYNGKEFNFNTIQVVSAGERDPDSDDATGMSGTKMRDAAKKGDFNTFKKGLPTALTTADGRRLMNELRQAMGLESVKEQVTVTDWLRESYYRGEVFKVGQFVESNGERYEILDRGSNYLTVVDASGNTHRKWLHDVTIVEDITTADAPTKFTYKNYTPQNILNSQVLDVFMHLSKQNADPVAVLNALKSTDEYYGILNKAIANDVIEESEVAEFNTALQKAQEYLAKLGVLHHHVDYINNAIHEIDRVRAQYHMEKDEQMEESMKTFRDLMEMKFSASDKIKVARIIADALGVPDVEKSSSADQLVNNALRKIRNKPMRPEYTAVLKNMLQTAKEAGINYDEKLVPQKVEEGYDEVSTSDVRLDKRGRKIPAHKLMFKNADKTKMSEEAPVAPAPKVHRIAVTVSEPDHPMVTKRKETKQKFVRVTHNDNKEEAIARGKKHFAKKGYKVHGAEHAGMMHEDIDLDDILQALEEAVSTIDKGEYDYEGAMARTQLQTVVRNSQELINMLSMDTNMPEWVQSKITLAQDYISSVRDYLKSREELGEEVELEESHVEFRIDHREKMSGDHKSTFASHNAKVSDTTDKATYVKVPKEKADSFKSAMKSKHGVRAELAEETVSEATPYYNKPSFLKKMSRVAKQERQAREKKEAEQKKPVKEESVYDTHIKGQSDYGSIVKKHGLIKTKQIIRHLKSERDSMRKSDWAGPAHLKKHDFAIKGLKRAIGEEVIDEGDTSDLPRVKKDKDSGLPQKYVAGVSKATAKARAAHWKEKDKLSDSDPRAYEPAPGDATAKTKPSKHTLKYRKMYGEDIDEACWTGYKQVGLKKKGSRMVPNCVPEAVNPAQQAAIAIAMKKAGKKPQNEEVEVDDDEYKFIVGDTGKLSYDALKRFMGIQNVAELGDLKNKKSFTSMQLRQMYEEQEKEDDIDEDDFEDEIQGMSEPDHIIDAYDDEEFAIVDDETGEELDTDGYEDDDKDEEAKLKEGKIVILEISRMERIRRKQRFARTKSKREVRSQIALRRTSNQTVINKRARRLATSMIKRRLLRKDPNKATLPEKERVERFLQTRRALIDRLARRVAPRIRQIEKSRLQHKRFTK